MAMEACGEERQVKLIGASLHPFVLRVRIALVLKGIDYQFIEDDVIQNQSQLLLQSNPVYNKIPVLIHNGKPICEAMNIVQYIDEAWDTNAPILIPKDPYDRAIARFWASFVDIRLMPFLGNIIMGQGEHPQKAVEELVAKFIFLEETLQTSGCLLGKTYFGGAEIGVVDIVLGGTSVFVKALEKLTNSVLIDAEKMPLLSAWTDRFCEADGVKEIMPDPVKLLEFICAMRIRFTSTPAASPPAAFEERTDSTEDRL